MFPLRVIGFQREFSYESAYAEIPKFWDEICEKYAANVYAGNAPANAYEQALVDNCIVGRRDASSLAATGSAI